MVKMINAKEFKDKQRQPNDDVLAGQGVVVTHSTKQPIRITSSMQNNIRKKKAFRAWMLLIARPKDP